MADGDLRALEELKARYCRLLDTKDWAGWRECFTDGFHSDTTASGGKVIDGADEFVGFVSRMLAKAVTVHQVQQPELTVEPDGTAHGIWAMLDIVRLVPGVTMHGFGHYHETYEKVSGDWRISSSVLTRLREEIRTPVFGILVSDRMRSLARRAVR